MKVKLHNFKKYNKHKTNKMKKIILLGFVATMMVVGCKQEAKDAQVGAYKIEKQVIKGDSSETTYLASDGNVQYKIYTPNEYFYVSVGKDSSVGFGVGTYTSKDGKIVETNIYNSGGLDTAANFNLDIIKTEKGYTQVLNEITMRGQKYKLTEEYTTVSGAATSALDGVWKQSKDLVVTGKDTADKTYNEYKVYQNGHFAWAAHNKADSTSTKYTTYVGHGTFTLNKDALTETLDLSNISGGAGIYNIVVTFNGTDEFTQKTVDSVKNVVDFKTYKKLKK